MVVLEQCIWPNIREARLSANLAVTRMAHWIARVGSARQRLDIYSTWLPGCGRATARRREREGPWPLSLPALPTIWRPHLLALPASRARGKCQGAAGARVRGAVQRFRLDGSAGHKIVDLLQGGKVVSLLGGVCGSYGGRVVRRSLLGKCLVLRRLGDCWPCATCCWVSCLVPSALHDLTVFLGKFCVPGLVHFLRFCPAPFCAAELLNVSDRACA